MSSPHADASVRLARMTDIDDIARVQQASWDAQYAGQPMAEVLSLMAADELALQWGRAILNPPAPGCRVLVACAGESVVGFIAVGPSGDPDLPDGHREGDLAAIHVDPAYQRQGHGSRLLMAAMDYLRGDGFDGALAWVTLGDDARRAFLQSAGWAPDSARRDLEVDDGLPPLREVRLATSLLDP